MTKEAPEIACEFDEQKNGISTDDIAVASNKKVWWKCSVCGFEWQSKVNNRTSTLKTGCPQCAKMQNKMGKRKVENLVAKNGSLFDHDPVLCQEWDYSKNELKPTEVSLGSGKKVWWICNLGHSYQACINHRTTVEQTGCPYCANKKVLPGYNDLATTHPSLLKEWDYEKNSIQPTEIHAGAHLKIWWKCCYCGEEYEASPEKRSSRPLGCVRCRRKRTE